MLRFLCLHRSKCIRYLPASRSLMMVSELSISNDKLSALPAFNRFKKTESRRFIDFLNSFWRSAASLGWYFVRNLQSKKKALQLAGAKMPKVGKNTNGVITLFDLLSLSCASLNPLSVIFFTFNFQ